MPDCSHREMNNLLCGILCLLERNWSITVHRGIAIVQWHHAKKKSINKGEMTPRTWYRKQKTLCKACQLHSKIFQAGGHRVGQLCVDKILATNAPQ